MCFLQIQDKVEIPYSEIPGFPVSSVSGHSGQLVCGTLEGVPVAALQGMARGAGSLAEDLATHLTKQTSLSLSHTHGFLRFHFRPCAPV